MRPGWRRLAELAESFNAGLLRARNLRFGLGYVKGSEVRQQFYCELKLHYDYERGLVDLSARDNYVRRLVAKILKASRKPTERGWVRTPLVAEDSGVPMIATPDALLVSGNDVVAVVKLSTGRSRRVFLSEEAVARLHLHMLKLLGFNVSGTRYYYVKTAVESAETVLESLKRNPENPSIEGAYVYTFVYDEQRCQNLVSYALAYWRMLRDPEPRPSPSKCGSCSHAVRCPYATLTS